MVVRVKEKEKKSEREREEERGEESRRKGGMHACSVVAASVCFLQVMRRRGRGYSAQELAPLRAALAELTSAIRAATAPAEPHPDLYPTVMCIPGFTREELLVALSYLVDGRGRGAAFLAMSEPHRALWIKHILAKQEI
uniref:Uncharacterized protein n=1 Tax=Setaria viridis TaxID=4556 RepID=A0A4U6TI16_SETVI|nr:hypothetical protein SEVIR_8G094200v2 [Setaria viridis]